MNESEELQLMQEWYSRNYVLYEMQYCHFFDREVCFMKPKHRREQNKQTMFRYFSIFKPKGFNYVLNEMIDYQSNKMSLNVYASLGQYDELLNFGSDLRMRKKATDEWNENRWKHCVSYDFFCDIDSPNREYVTTAKADTFKIVRYLDSFSMPYYLRFSGMGYHVIIPYRYFRHLGLHFNPHEPEGSIYALYNAILDKLHEKFTEFIDLNIHDSPRVTKSPYSLSFYDDGCYVCWPFNTLQEFYAHHPKDYFISRQLVFKGEKKIFRRGQTLYNTEKWTEACTDSFLKSLGIEVKKDE